MGRLRGFYALGLRFLEEDYKIVMYGVSEKGEFPHSEEFINQII